MNKLVEGLLSTGPKLSSFLSFLSFKIGSHVFTRISLSFHQEAKQFSSLNITSWVSLKLQENSLMYPFFLLSFAP